MRKIEKIIIHCTATPPRLNVNVQEVRRWHLARGWRDIGYHYLIKRDGTIEKGRPEEQIGSHCKGYNRYSIGICYVGGVDELNRPQDNRTEAQKRSLIELLYELQKLYPEATIHGHNEFNKHKACPSFNVQEWLKQA